MAFNVPINSIAPTPTPPDWVRASDWPVITDTPNEVQFLVCDTGAKAFTIRTTFTRTSGNIYIDWGDGVTDTITSTSTTDTSHVYSTGGTPCSRGYNTWKIRVYGDATCVIANARHIPNFAVTGGSPFYNIGLLEAYYGNGTCGSASFSANYFNSNTTTVLNGTFNLLEYVKLPSTVSWTNQFVSMFNACPNLYVVVMPTSASSLTSLANAFTNCTNLLDIALPSNSTAITSLSATFQACTNLRTLTFPTSLNSCTTMATMCSDCSSLKNATLPSINLVTSFSSTFGTCRSLQWVRINSLPSPVSPSTTITATNMFQGSNQLQNVYLPASCSSNAIYSGSAMFSGCSNLKNIILPTNFNASTLATAFLSCFSITNITFPTTMTSLTDISNCFANCTLLRTITLPTTVGSTITLQTTFGSCTSLSSITIPSGWNITNLSNTFQNCFNLTSLTLPNNAQNSCTSMNAMCNACPKLQTIVMPTSLNLVNTLAVAFGNCYELQSITFPATMDAVTTIGSCFTNCYSISNITLPTSMSACINFSNAFQACYNLKTLTLPSTVSSSLTTYAQLCDTCSSLVTLTLPTTQTSLLTSAQNMFNACGNLTTINNLGKLGSLTSTPLVLLSNNINPGVGTNLLTGLNFNCPISQFSFNGSSTTQNFNKLSSIRLFNTSAGQWTGSSPQINISFCDINTAKLNQLFADIAAQGNVTSKTINITSCTGAAGLTAADRLVITSKGWTITG